MLRFDFLAIKKTWSPVCVSIVEVKVSRSDFTHDDKWAQYLPSCNRFYWACPTGMIKPDEIDPRCGLIYFNYKNSTTRAVKAAIYRDQPPDSNVLLYLLLWRNDPANRADIRKEIKQEMEEDQALGKRYASFVSKKLQSVQDKLEAADDRGWSGAVELVCREMKIDKRDVPGLIKDAASVKGVRNLMGDLRRCGERLEAVAEEIKTFGKGADED